MSDATFIDRVNRLVEVRVAERRQQLPHEAAAIASSMAERGVVMSSMHVLHLRQLYARELEIRAVIVWETIVRVHRTLGSSVPTDGSNTFKQMFTNYLASNHTELAAQLAEGAARFGGGMKVDLAEDYALAQRKHTVEIDLYFDSLASTVASGASVSANYNFYGNVGAFQTGPNSVANVVQNLAATDRDALDAALRQVAEALTAATSLPDKQRTELTEIAVECQTLMESPSPNNTKLLTMFNVLATAVQSIASAQPAYQALKLALLPLGVSLP